MAIEQDSLTDDFRCFYKEISAVFPAHYGLPRRLLDTFSDREKAFFLKQLVQLAKKWCPLKDQTGLPKDAFEKLVMRAISLLRGAAIHLRQEGKNAHGFTITRPDFVPGSVVQWNREPAVMDEIISSP